MSDARFDATAAVITSTQALNERADQALKAIAEMVLIIQDSPAPESFKSEANTFYTGVADLLATYQVVTRELVETCLSTMDMLEKVHEKLDGLRDENNPYNDTKE